LGEPAYRLYDNYHLMCAIVTKVGRGANLPADAIFPLSLFDDAHRPLDASNKYTIQFDKGTMPPVGADAFWSIALHDKDGFEVTNSSQRFVVSSWMPFNDNGSGSLDRYFQNESQGADRQTGCPHRRGRFNVTMRLYAPRMEADAIGSRPGGTLTSRASVA